MRLRSLALTSFRNIASLSIEPDERFTIFHGDNGQGKTNILEAIYLLSYFKSFRRATLDNLVRHGDDEAVVAATFEEREIERTMQLRLAPGGREVHLDGKRQARMAPILGTVFVVVFTPDDLDITKGSASGRRLFLNRAVFGVERSYMRILHDYEKAVTSRNKLLKQRFGVDATFLSSMDEQLATLGAKIVASRRAYVDSLEPVFVEAFRSIYGTDSTVSVGCRYASSLEVGDEDETRLGSMLFDALQSCRRHDMDRGRTTVGPHLDELAVTINGDEARFFASQGQHRALVIALKIAEMEQVIRATREVPILLLDDISSELDAANRETLVSYIRDKGEQVFITTTDAAMVDRFTRATSFEVAGGAIVSEGRDVS